MSNHVFINVSSLPAGLYVLIGFGLLYAFMSLDERREDKKEKRHGYRVLWVSSAILRGDEGEWAVEYREKGQSLFFLGKEVKRSQNTLDVPSAEHWDESVPEWAWGRREEILRRVRAEEDNYNFAIREI